MTASPMPEGALPTPAVPQHVGTTLHWLAHLIDSSIAVRVVEDEEEFAQRHLGVHASHLVSVREYPSPVSFTLAGRAFAADLRVHPPTEIAGCDSDESPAWDRLKFEGADESVPGALVAAFPAGTIADVPLVVCFDNRHNSREIDVFAHADHRDAAAAYLRDLLARGRGELNWFRGKSLRVKWTPAGLAFEAAHDASVSRADLVLPSSVWRELDVNISGLFERRDLLTDLGLGTNRGVLLYGPPGTGKTAACKTIAAELVGRVTVLFCEARAMAENLEELYAELAFLGASLVVLEDIDLIVGHRSTGASGALLGFLTALDGAMSMHTDVLTLATTNDPRAIDEAAKRAARFDRLIEVPLPARDARIAILTRYLGPLTEAVDAVAVAAATEGASGADLRELVRRSVLEYGDDVTTARVLRLVDTGAWHDESVIGLYL